MIPTVSVFTKACKSVGVELISYYPITPAMSFIKSCKKELKTIMAEDEISAINMAIGASIIGKTSCVVTSGPGLNLMTEGLNYAFMAEVPLVVFDFQRAGPATGIPTKTLEQDESYINNCIFGVNKNPIFYPKTQKEMYTHTIEAFKLAEKLKRPVFIMSDFSTSVTYETEISLDTKSVKLDIDRKHFYTGLFTVDDVISEDIEALQNYLDGRKNDFMV